MRDCPRCEGPLDDMGFDTWRCPVDGFEWRDDGPPWSLTEIRQRVRTVTAMARRGEL